MSEFRWAEPKNSWVVLGICMPGESYFHMILSAQFRAAFRLRALICHLHDASFFPRLGASRPCWQETHPPFASRTVSIVAVELLETSRCWYSVSDASVSVAAAVARPTGMFRPYTWPLIRSIIRSFIRVLFRLTTFVCTLRVRLYCLLMPDLFQVCIIRTFWPLRVPETVGKDQMMVVMGRGASLQDPRLFGTIHVTIIYEILTERCY